VVQEIALAQSATIHCGRRTCSWKDFTIAMEFFAKHFEQLRPKLQAYFGKKYPKLWQYKDDSTIEINHLGAKILVDMTTTLFKAN
jgi:hypothetical protein